MVVFQKIGNIKRDSAYDDEDISFNERQLPFKLELTYHTVLLARSLVKPDIMQELFDKKSGQQRCITAAQLSNPLENPIRLWP